MKAKNLLTEDHIGNPYKRKTPKKKEWVTGKISFNQITKPKDNYEDIQVDDWEAKHFVFWFISCLEKNFPDLPKYNIVYKKDCKNISILRKAFINEGHNNNDLKDFIAHIVEYEAQKVMDKKGKNSKYISFTTNDLLGFINDYLQQLQFSKPQFQQDKPVVSKEELYDCWKEGKLFSLLRNYGIPIAATFVFMQTNDKKATDEAKNLKIKKAIENILSKTNNENLEKIAQHSIMRGSYNEKFKFLNWRDVFVDYWNKIGVQNNSWWQDENIVDNNPLKMWWF